MTPIAWVVEHSLQASERFRHLTVLPEPDQDMAEINDLLASGDSLDYAEGMALLEIKINKIVAANYYKYWD